MLSKKEAKYKEIIPLANIIWDLHIGRNELISFKVAVNEAVQQYGFTASTAAFHVLNNIRDYNRIGGLKKELNKLTTQIAKQYNIPPSVAAIRLFNEIRDYKKIGGMKTEISRLCQQIFVVNGICANQNKAMRAVLNLQSLGITEDRILYLNNILQNKGYRISTKFRS